MLCLFAFSFMLFQVALLRELRFQLTTLFTLTPFLFSTVVVCIAVGSLIAGKIRERSGQVLRWSILLLPILVPLLFASTIVISQSLLDSGSSRFNYGAMKDPSGGDAYLHSTFIAFVAVAAGGYGLLFVLQGLIFSIYFREGRERGLLSGLYGADMIASGIGALVGGALNFALTPVQTVLVAAAALLITLWISFKPLGIKAALVACASVLTLTIVAGELSQGILSRLENPHWLPGMKFTVWSRYRRIDVAEPPGNLLVFTDGMPFHIYNRKDRAYLQDPRKLPVELIRRSEHPIRDVLIIGGGTGADVVVLRDLVPTPLNITAVELDPGFIKTAQGIPWLWEYYRTADIYTQEGRYFLENTSKQFDLVIFAYVDPQSAISSIGLPDANFLYTDAGLRAAWSRVRDGGYLLVQRVFLKQEQEHFIRRLCATFESAGIPPAHARVHVSLGVGAWGYYGRISSLQTIARKGGEPMWLEDKSFVPQPWDSQARPTTDLFPFSLGTGIWFDTLLS